MKILGIDIDWMLGYGNDPRIMVKVDKLPDLNNLIYEQKGNLYFSHTIDGYVNFYAVNALRETGYGGRSFTLNMANGTTKVLKGPWSSRAGVMNNAGFEPCVDVSYVEEITEACYGGSISKNVLSKAMLDFCPLYSLEIDLNDAEHRYIVPKSQYKREVTI